MNIVWEKEKHNHSCSAVNVNSLRPIMVSVEVAELIGTSGDKSVFSLDQY